MKIKIVPERCISCGICHIKSPSTFDYHDNGIVKFYTTKALEEEFPDTAENLQAVKSCPTAALQLVKEQR